LTSEAHASRIAESQTCDKDSTEIYDKIEYHNMINKTRQHSTASRQCMFLTMLNFDLTATRIVFKLKSSHILNYEHLTRSWSPFLGRWH